MTEPVAYLVSQEPLSSVRWVSKDKPIGVDDKQITPLYTAEQLHPRVKMTQAEFDEWNELYQYNTLFSSAMALLDDDKYVEKYNNLYMKIYTGEDAQNIYNEAVFAELWAEYDPDHPEETIEIVHDMKWFVRSKDKNDEGYYSFLNNVIQLTLNWVYSKDKNKPHKEAVSFDNKEEAEKWTNPITEAVQLPVEDK